MSIPVDDQPARATRPIAVRFGAMGDMVMFLPALAQLAARWRTPVDVVSSGPWTDDILDSSSVIGDRVILPGTRRRPHWLSPAKRAMVRWLRDRPGAPVFVFERNGKFDEFLHRAAIPAGRIARLLDVPEEPSQHQIEEECAFARDALANAHAPLEPCSVEPPCLSVSDSAVADARGWLDARHIAEGPLVLIQPGNKKTMRKRPAQRSSNIKYWPLEHWVHVLESVRRSLPSAGIVICGVPPEQPIALELAARAGLEPASAAADDLPLRRLFALQSMAHSMISVDTGPAHSAVAVGCPTVVFYGTTNPRRFGPRGTGPLRVVTQAGHFRDGSEAVWRDTPLVDIQPQAVVAGWKDLVGI